jgi:uncharacterized protein YggE
MKKSIYLSSVIIASTFNVLAQSTGNANYQQTTSTVCSSGNAILNDSYGNISFVNYNPPKGVNLTTQVNSGSLTPIKADVMMNVKASSYVAILSITQAGESIMETDSLMDIRLNNVFDELRVAGIPLDNTHVDFISMLPTYEFEMTEKRYSKTMNEVPTGFEMKKNIHVKFTDHDRVNDLISAAARAEIYDLVKIDYNVANMDQIYTDLRKKAEEIIQTKTESYKRMGFNLEAQNYGTTQGSVYPMERYVKYTAANTGIPKVYSKKASKDKEKPIEYNYAEKNKTVYYERVPYGQFDVVLNADMVEPTVQFYYSMNVNYRIVIEEVAKREKEDRELDLLLRRTQIQQQIKNAGGNPAIVNTTVNVRTK